MHSFPSLWILRQQWMNSKGLDLFPFYLSVCLCVCLSVCLSIYEFYTAPLQGNYLKTLPTQAQVKNKSFKELVKRAGQIPWKRAEFIWETIPGRGTIEKALCCLMAERA